MSGLYTQPELVVLLEHILDRTDDAEGVPVSSGYFGERKADVRRYQDNIGRLEFRRARRAAWRGLQAAMGHDLETAEVYLRHARAHLLNAYETVVTPEQLKSLGGRAERRGRKPSPKNLERRVSEAMLALSTEIDLETLELAFRAEPSLRADFKKRSIQEASLLKAVRELRRDPDGNK